MQEVGLLMALEIFRGFKPAVAEGVFIAPGARVIGRVSIGRGSSIWHNAVVRGDVDSITIGEETNIQDNATIHVDRGSPAEIGNRVTVGHNAVLHGCIVEDEVLVGIGAIVLSGAVIGRGSLVGAGALVPSGVVIPPRSLVVGIPGRVVRELADDELPVARGNYRRYCDLAREYLERG
jgi:carbonic anhydrase/acetyltransferase-like protein (isoleucine patch superfamily)